MFKFVYFLYEYVKKNENTYLHYVIMCCVSVFNTLNVSFLLMFCK